MAKRTTRTNAETLENVRRQAEARGRELGRADLAVELRNHIGTATRSDLLVLWSYLVGRDEMARMGGDDNPLDGAITTVKAALNLVDALDRELAQNTPF